MRSLLLFVVVALVSGGPDTGILYPGYVVNYNVDKNTLDSRFTFLPIVDINPSDGVTLVLDMHVEAITGASPTSEIRWKQWTTPQDPIDLPILTGGTNGDSYEVQNVTSDNYFLSVKSSCTGTTCGDIVETSISAYTYRTNVSNSWPPFQLLDQRRTAKFTLNSKTWLYFWLAVTDSLLTNILKMNLYLGVQFWNSGSSSSIQVVIYNDSPTWPTGTVNVTLDPLAKYYYPIDPNQRNDWVMSTPLPLDPGLYQVCFFNPLANQAKFTTKNGFNKPPLQAANLNASWNPLGLLALVLMCITAILKH